jgi:hypothetical protein
LISTALNRVEIGNVGVKVRLGIHISVIRDWLIIKKKFLVDGRSIVLGWATHCLWFYTGSPICKVLTDQSHFLPLIPVAPVVQRQPNKVFLPVLRTWAIV